VAIFVCLFGEKLQRDELQIKADTRKFWIQRLKKQIKLTLMKLKSKDYKNGFLELLGKGFGPVSYPANLKIPPLFSHPTEVHLFSG